MSHLFRCHTRTHGRICRAPLSYQTEFGSGATTVAPYRDFAVPCSAAATCCVQVATCAWRAILEKELYQGPTLSRSPSLLRSSTVALAINAGDPGLPAAAALHFGVSQSVHAVANYLFHDFRGAAIIAGPPALLRSLRRWSATWRLHPGHYE